MSAPKSNSPATTDAGSLDDPLAAYFKAKQASLLKTASVAADALPPEPGTAPIPPNTIRLYHYTSPANLDSIRQHGLLNSKARGDGGGGPSEASAGVWASTKAPSDSHNFIEFWAAPDDISSRANYPNNRWENGKKQPLTPEEWQEFAANLNHVILNGDVPVNQIVAIHEPWHQKVRYLISHDSINKQPDLFTDESIEEFEKDRFFAEAKACRWLWDHKDSLPKVGGRAVQTRQKAVESSQSIAKRSRIRTGGHMNGTNDNQSVSSKIASQTDWLTKVKELANQACDAPEEDRDRQLDAFWNEVVNSPKIES